MRTDRTEYIDIAKGIAIISVIIGHLNISVVNRIVFTYHLPLFLLITGFFVNDRLSDKDFAAKKIRTLMLPYFATCIAIISLGITRGVLRGNAVQEGTRWVIASLYGSGVNYNTPFYIPMIGGIWYLPATCIGTILLRLTIGAHEQIRPIIICFFFAIGYFTSKWLFWFPMSVQAGLCVVLFMYVGWLIKRNDAVIKDASKEMKIFMVIIMAITWIMFILQFSGFSIARNNYGRGIVDIIGAVSGSILMILISQRIEKWSILSMLRRILVFAGRYSLLILCIHIIELDLIPLEKVAAYFLTLPMEIIKWTMLFLKPAVLLLAAFILLKSRWVRKLFCYDSVKVVSQNQF